MAGRVQGVGFRWFTQDIARRLGLTGTVRNTADGKVEVQAFGSSVSLDRLRSALEEGPPSARVTAVDETEIGSDSAPSEFSIIG